VPARLVKALAAGVLLALAFPQSAAGEWHFTPMVGTTFFIKTSLLDPDAATDQIHRNYGGSVALLGGGILGVEGLVVWTPGAFTGDKGLVESSRSIAVMGNVVITAPRRWTEYSLRPFVSGGFGLINVSKTEVLQVFPFNSNLPAFNIGGGAIGFLSQRTGLRFDLRYYSGLARSDNPLEDPIAIGRVHIRYMTASVGVVLRR
jgi:hypothetical protein